MLALASNYAQVQQRHTRTPEYQHIGTPGHPGKEVQPGADSGKQRQHFIDVNLMQKK